MNNTSIINRFVLASFFLFLTVGFCFAQMSKKEQARFGLAQSYNNTGTHTKAIDILAELYTAHPRNKSVAIEYGKAMAYGGRPDDAIPVLMKLANKYPADKYITRTLASTYEIAQQPDKARKYYLILLKSAPDDLQLLLKTANTSMWMKDYNSAVKYYRKALQREPENILHLKSLAKALYAEENIQESQALYTKVLKEQPDDSESISNMIEILIAGEKFSEALILLDKQPASRGVTTRKARLRQATGDHAGAIKAFKRLLSEKEDIRIRLEMANSLFAIGDLESAENEYNTVLEKQPDDFSTLHKTANIMLAQRKYEQAISLVRKLQINHPNDRNMAILLAKVLSLRREYSESVQIYRKVISEHPDWIEPRRELARVLGWARNYRESITAYKDLVDRYTEEKSFGLEMEGKRNWYRHFTRKAEDAYLKLVAIEPDNYEALFDLAQIYSINRRWQSAVKTYDRLLSIYPEDTQTARSAEKARSYMSGWTANILYMNTDAASANRQVERNVNLFGLKTSRHLPADLSAGIDYSYSNYKYANNNSIARHDILGTLSYSILPSFSAEIKSGITTLNREIEDSIYIYTAALFSPHDAVDIHLSYNRDRLDENRQVFHEEIEREEYRSRVDLKLDRRLIARGHYYKSGYSDSNDRHGYRLDLKGQLMFEPHSLVLEFAHEEYSFDNESELYFAPDDFWFDEITLRWRHFIGSEEQRWGSRQTYYTLGYTFNRDKFKEDGHTLHAGLHHDWTDRFSTNAEYTRTRYTDTDVYTSDIWMIYARLLL